MLGLAAAALVAALGVGGWLLLRPDDDPAAGVPQDRPGPVLLVPGYGGDTTALTSLAATLQASGRQATVVDAVGDGTGDLREQAAALDVAAREQLAAGAPSVDVIGYSAGGVTARLWASELGGADVARRVVTLGAPHHGTGVAALAAAFAPASCPPACRQLVEGNDLLDALDETPDGPAWTSIWTTQDQVVTPPDSARLEGAVNVEVQQVCPDAQVTHGALPTDPLVVALVVRALAVEPLDDVPAPAECAALRGG